MENILLSPIPLEALTGILTAIVRDEIRAAKKEELQERLLTKKEAASFLKVSESTIDNWADSGAIQKHYRGRLCYFKQYELEASLTHLKKYQRV